MYALIGLLTAVFSRGLMTLAQQLKLLGPPLDEFRKCIAFFDRRGHLREAIL